jgi:hypothetical protein
VALTLSMKTELSSSIKKEGIQTDPFFIFNI